MDATRISYSEARTAVREAGLHRLTAIDKLVAAHPDVPRSEIEEAVENYVDSIAAVTDDDLDY
jgi:hypothetical protein